jgi:hypothetical protein
VVDERHAHDYQLKANLFVTMQEEIGTAKQMVRVSRDALTSELRWALLHCDNCLAWEEHELPSGRLALFATGADIVSWSWICQLVGARDDEHAFAAPLPARRVRFRSATQRSTASSGTRASRFDDAQLTALSNPLPLRAEQLGGRQRRRQRRRARSAQGRRGPADAGTRAPAPFRRASAPSFAVPRPSRPH